MKHTPSDLVKNRRRLQGIAVVLFGSLTLVEPAYAYLDPGTGSIIVQIFLGGLAGLAVAGKLFWSRIADFFSDLFTRNGSWKNRSSNLPPDEPNLDAGQASEQNDKKQ